MRSAAFAVMLAALLAAAACGKLGPPLRAPEAPETAPEESP